MPKWIRSALLQWMLHRALHEKSICVRFSAQ